MGKMLDIRVKSEDVDTTRYGEDPMLYIQNLVTWHDYRGKIIGTADAEVEIEDQGGIRTQFIDIGNGIYRDVNNSLRVKPLTKYKLRVIANDETYTAETMVPGNFNFSNITEGDTADVNVHLDGNIYINDFYVHWTNSDSKFFYRTLRQTSVFNQLVLNHLYEPPNGIPLIIIDTSLVQSKPIISAWITATSLDTNFGTMYSPEQTSTAPIDLLTYLSNQETTPLPERTRISGKDVVGVFGSMNCTKRVVFYMRAVKNN